MYLSETKPGDAVIVKSLRKIDSTRKNSLRDMGLYEYGVVYIDTIDGNSVRFHKDSNPITISIEEAKRVEVTNVRLGVKKVRN